MLREREGTLGLLFLSLRAHKQTQAHFMSFKVFCFVLF